MIKFEKNEFSELMICSTNDKYETRCRVTKEIVEDIKNLQNKEQDKLDKKMEKQQLISFLKHLIGETECAYNYKENEYKNSGKWNLLNEILDFVKGDENDL